MSLVCSTRPQTRSPTTNPALQLNQARASRPFFLMSRQSRYFLSSGTPTWLETFALQVDPAIIAPPGPPPLTSQNLRSPSHTSLPLASHARLFVRRISQFAGLSLALKFFPRITYLLRPDPHLVSNHGPFSEIWSFASLIVEYHACTPI